MVRTGFQKPVPETGGRESVGVAAQMADPEPGAVKRHFRHQVARGRGRRPDYGAPAGLERAPQAVLAHELDARMPTAGAVATQNLQPRKVAIGGMPAQYFRGAHADIGAGNHAGGQIQRSATGGRRVSPGAP